MMNLFSSIVRPFSFVAMAILLCQVATAQPDQDKDKGNKHSRDSGGKSYSNGSGKQYDSGSQNPGRHGNAYGNRGDNSSSPSSRDPRNGNDSYSSGKKSDNLNDKSGNSTASS